MNAKEIVISKLLDLDVCLHEDDSEEYTVRCPYCGDSKTPTHAHLGIFIDVDDPTMPMLWNCLRCGEGGIVSDQLLDDLGVYLDEDEFKELKAYDRKVKRLSGIQRNKMKANRYKVPPDVSDKKYLEKLRYAEERIGAPLVASENKLILSLVDFFAFNEIEYEKIPKVNGPIVAALDQNYVGFLSADNNCITFRYIGNKKGFKRYYKILLNPFIPENASFYSIPSTVPLLYTDDLNVYIAEGTFDILSVKHNIIKDKPNSVFYAACGYSYINIIKYLARMGLCTGLNLHIYADRDKTDDDHIKMLKEAPVSAFVQHAFLHRNGIKTEKDYGVPLAQIKDTRRKLW